MGVVVDEVDGTSPVRPGGSPVLVLDQEDLRGGLLVLRRHLGRVPGDGPPELVLDLSGLTGLSSVAVAVLLRARRSCRARGGRLVLHRPHRDVLAVLRRSGLEGLFDVVDDSEDPGPADRSDPVHPRRARAS